MRSTYRIKCLITTVCILLVLGEVKSLQLDPLECRILLNEVVYDTNHTQSDGNRISEFYSCNLVVNGTIEGLMYMIDLSDPIQTEVHTILMNKADVFLRLDGAEVDTDSIMIPENTTVEIVQPYQIKSFNHERHRQLNRAPSHEGTLSMFVIRVIATDAAPYYSADFLYQTLFTAPTCMKSHFEACSFNKLHIEPTSFKVLDVQIDIPAQGNSNIALMNAAEIKANQMIQSQFQGDIRTNTDLLMFSIPPGTGSWAAFATVSGKQSVFNDRWAAYLGAQMHEVGHNLGLHHAYEGGIEYRGETGYMGGVPGRLYGPLRCYNGQNYWQLGWMDDRTLEMTPALPQLVKIAAFVDYELANANEYTLVKVESIYLLYNRQKGMNSQTGDKGNDVTIVRGLSDRSSLLAGLDLNNPLYQEQNGSDILTINVCDVVNGDSTTADFMVVSVGYGKSLCSSYKKSPPTSNIPPSPLISPSPTRSPGQSPLISPSPTQSPGQSIPGESPTAFGETIEANPSAPPTKPPSQSTVAGVQNQNYQTQSSGSNAGILAAAVIVSCLIFIAAGLIVRQRTRRSKVYFTNDEDDVPLDHHQVPLDLKLKDNPAIFTDSFYDTPTTFDRHSKSPIAQQKGHQQSGRYPSGTMLTPEILARMQEDLPRPPSMLRPRLEAYEASISGQIFHTSSPATLSPSHLPARQGYTQNIKNRMLEYATKTEYQKEDVEIIPTNDGITRVRTDTFNPYFDAMYPVNCLCPEALEQQSNERHDQFDPYGETSRNRTIPTASSGANTSQPQNYFGFTFFSAWA